jgi:hypothetical protein
LNILRKWVKEMKVECIEYLSELALLLLRKDIKVKFITRGSDCHYVFYKEKLLPKIIKTILHKK